MADKTVTVKPSGGTYTTLQNAIAGEVVANANLVTMDGILTISIEGDWSGGPDTAAVTINGFTMDATRYLVIQADSANRAIKTSLDATRYILSVTDADAINVNDSHVRIYGLQIRIVYAAATGKSCIFANDDSDYLQVGYCRLVGHPTTAQSRGATLNSGSVANYIFNTIIENHRIGLYVGGTNNYIYNCIVYNINQEGVWTTGSSNWYIRNTASFTTADDFYDGTSGTYDIDYVALDDTDAFAHHVHPSGGNWANEFNNAAAGDWTLLVGGNCVGAGVDDPGSGLYSDDIDRAARASTWDIGADEYVAAGGGTVPVFMHHYKMQRRVF